VSDDDQVGPQNRDTPRWCQGVTARLSDWDPVRGLHQGQRSFAPHQQAGHMTAPRNDYHQSKTPLRKRGHPHMTPPSSKQCWTRRRSMRSLAGPKADLPRGDRWSLVAQSTPRRALPALTSFMPTGVRLATSALRHAGTFPPVLSKEVGLMRGSGLPTLLR
jgi:hypothetical protein